MNRLFNFLQSTLPLHSTDLLNFNEDSELMRCEPVLFASDSGASGGGGREATPSDEKADKPAVQPPHASVTPEGDSDNEDGSQEENQPGLQPKNDRYFKSDTQADTGIGNA